MSGKPRLTSMPVGIEWGTRRASHPLTQQAVAFSSWLNYSDGSKAPLVLHKGARRVQLSSPHLRRHAQVRTRVASFPSERRTIRGFCTRWQGQRRLRFGVANIPDRIRGLRRVARSESDRPGSNRLEHELLREGPWSGLPRILRYWVPCPSGLAATLFPRRVL